MVRFCLVCKKSIETVSEKLYSQVQLRWKVQTNLFAFFIVFGSYLPQETLVLKTEEQLEIKLKNFSKCLRTHCNEIPKIQVITELPVGQDNMNSKDYCRFFHKRHQRGHLDILMCSCPGYYLKLDCNKHIHNHRLNKKLFYLKNFKYVKKNLSYA